MSVKKFFDLPNKLIPNVLCFGLWGNPRTMEEIKVQTVTNCVIIDSCDYSWC